MPPSWSAQECNQPAEMEVAVLTGVVFSVKTGKLSVFSFCEFWLSKGSGCALCGVSEVDLTEGVSGFSEFELSELLAQLAASRTVSRQKARKLRGDGRFMGIQLSCICNGQCWGGGLFREGVSGRRIYASAWTCGWCEVVAGRADFMGWRSC